MERLCLAHATLRAFTPLRNDLLFLPHCVKQFDGELKIEGVHGASYTNLCISLIPPVEGCKSLGGEEVNACLGDTLMIAEGTPQEVSKTG